MTTSFAVVYLGGTCGQFVRVLLQSLLSGTHSDFQYSKYGSCHGFDIVNHNSTVPEYNKPSVHMVRPTQTHAFNRIPELIADYGKVIAITVDPSSKKEFIIRNINLLLKYNLEKHHTDLNDVPLLKNYLRRYVGRKYKDLATKIYDSRFDVEFKDICLYFLFSELFNNHTHEYGYFFEYEIETSGPTNGAIEMPFSIIINGDSKAFIKVIEKVAERSLTESELSYVEEMFFRYYNAQDKLLLTDPYQFMDDTKTRALEKLNILMQEYDQDHS